MKLDLIDKDLAKEIIVLLSYLGEEYYKYLDESIFKELNELSAESLLEVKFDKNKKFIEQEISDECKDFISILYYIKSKDDIKEELLKRWSSN